MAVRDIHLINQYLTKFHKGQPVCNELCCSQTFLNDCNHSYRKLTIFIKCYVYKVFRLLAYFWSLLHILTLWWPVFLETQKVPPWRRLDEPVNAPTRSVMNKWINEIVWLRGQRWIVSWRRIGTSGVSVTRGVVRALNRGADRCYSQLSTAEPRVVQLCRRFRAKDPTARLLGHRTASTNFEVGQRTLIFQLVPSLRHWVTVASNAQTNKYVN